jgi:hypothetical protein
MRLYEGRFDKDLFSCRIFGIPKLFQTQNHFDIDSKKTHSEEIQVIPMERLSEMMKTFCFAFGKKHEVTFGWSKWLKI